MNSAHKIGLIFAVILFTTLALYPVVGNDFVNWDDQEYVEKNVLVTQFEEHGVVEIFSTLSVMGAYTPLTIWSFALNHQAGGMDPTGYHLVNLLLHLLNVGWVFLLVLRITGKPWAAAFAALFWGIHPVNVESVAWVSARKDVLYAVFFLPGLWVWLDYIQSRKFKWCALSFVFFALAILAKPMAVTFPIMLLLLDYVQERRITIKRLLEKTPFFLVSGIMGIVNIIAQDSVGALADPGATGWGEKLMNSSWALFEYFEKILVPINLAAFHPFHFQTGGEIPAYFYLTLPVLAAIIAVVILFRKKRIVVFAFAFFVISLLPILQLLGFGSAITAERFAYVALVAPAILLGLSFNYLLERRRKNDWAIVGMFVMLAGLGGFGWITHRQTYVWENGMTLWTQVQNSHPDDGKGYANRGNYFSIVGDLDAAIAEYSLCLARWPEFAEAYNCRGGLFFSKGSYGDARDDFAEAYRLIPDDPSYRSNLGLALIHTGEYHQAEFHLAALSKEVPEDQDIWWNYAAALRSLEKHAEAVEAYHTALKLGEPKAPMYYDCASSLETLGRYDEAIEYFTLNLALEPQNKEGWIALVRCFEIQGDTTSASEAAAKAEALGFKDVRKSAGLE